MQTDPIGYQDGMNWYAYVGNDPVNGTDPTGMYGRGKGWSDEDWAAFDAAQKEAANEMSRTAISMREEAAALDNGTTNASGYDASDLRSIADKLDSGAVALRDDGSDGYVAHVGKASVMTGYFANVDKRGGKVLTVDVTHFQFGGPLTPFAVGHESLHSAGLEDQMDFTGKVPAYRYGSHSESRVAFRYLSKRKRVLNPDHIMCMVYKC